ncbi:MAG: mannose-1-phosphate guanylyltransferase [Bacteriovoracaceae bacterium]|nr:mannose-1-phosphate guanylyltransferase [Bacteriovoracaceae bacterium]
MAENANLYCLVMAGGRGTRFWPESTSKKPKQYLNLVSDRSLLADTIMRFSDLVPPERRFIVTVKEQEKLVEKESGELIGRGGIILEPSGRNTAPCILLSIATLLQKGASSDDVIAVVPADHVILNVEAFRDVIGEAFELAVTNDRIVTIGIPPTFPHTGHGYIQKGESIRDGVYHVARFKEKPDFETATSYLKSGDFFWNAGMFVGSIGVFLKEFEKHSPEIYRFIGDLKDNVESFEALSEIYEKIPKDSMDYAVMEKSDRVMVVGARFDWNDLGSWDALEAVIDKTDGNTIASSSGECILNSSGNIVFAPGKFVTLVNVNDLIIVSNDKNLMALPKKDSQKVREVVEFLKDHELGPELL